MPITTRLGQDSTKYDPLFRREGYIVTDSRTNCIPDGWHKVWVPSLHYADEEFDKEIASVGMNLGGLKASSYLKIIGNCDIYQVIQAIDNVGWNFCDPGTCETFVEPDAPKLENATKLDEKTWTLSSTDGGIWGNLGKEKIMAYQEQGNNLCSIQTLNVIGGTAPPNFERYEYATYKTYPVGMHVIVNTRDKIILGGVKKKYKPNPLVSIEVNENNNTNGDITLGGSSTLF